MCWMAHTEAHTIKIAGLLKSEPIVVLVDCGATQSFIDPQLAALLQLDVQKLVRPMRVRVANGEV